MSFLKINKFLFLNNKDNFQQNLSQKKDLCNKASQVLLTFMFVHVEILSNILDAIKSLEVLLFTWRRWSKFFSACETERATTQDW